MESEDVGCPEWLWMSTEAYHSRNRIGNQSHQSAPFVPSSSQHFPTGLLLSSSPSHFFPFFRFIDPNPITRWRRYFAPLFMCHKCDFYRENFLSQSLSELPLIRDQNQYKGIWKVNALDMLSEHRSRQRQKPLANGGSIWRKKVLLSFSWAFTTVFAKWWISCKASDLSESVFLGFFPSLPCLPETFKPRHKHTANKSHSKQSRL